MNGKRFVASGVCALLAFGFVAAQMGENPEPGPEHQKLGFFVGKWKSKGEMKETPFGPGGKFTMRDKCEWWEGGYSVVCMSEGKGPSGKMKGMGIMGYSPEQQAYTYYGVDNSPMTMTTVPQGTLEDDTWTYMDETEFGGETIRSRYTIKITSPTTYTFEWEMEGPDGEWTTVMQGQSRKA
jgi:hypothetical protein